MDTPGRINVEIACTKGFCKERPAPDLQQAIRQYIADVKTLPKDHVFQVCYPNVDSVMICDRITESTPRNNLCVITYLLRDETGEEETIEQDGDEIQIANHWMLPAREFHGMWESLIYDECLKDDLMSFMQTTMLFSRKNVNPNLIACNRLILLHGPPGTGKTSLCKALAQKLSIRMQAHYKHAHLIEINSHSLFSKWFSESGKLVQKVFGQIHELCQDQSSLVCVLVDEVESIAFARESISNNEPSDSIRVVNAVLTQLDRIRKYPNVFVLATSNLTGRIDLAFLDRADIVQFIGNPSLPAIYQIYRTALDDLQSAGVITVEDFVPAYEEATEMSVVASNLKSVANLSVGLSGRSLRKVPFLAHALFVQQEETTMLKFLGAMRNAVRRMRRDKEMLETKHQPKQSSDSNGVSSENATAEGTDNGQ
ncbi:pachytene checkpoint protein 2 homolog [Topomyia yanbarensis]|uniref:pachytene checkpoint protein 2 homolog n=1 Tax=Topomyia yanbarensis TaxID=2498891 RepID=UPI00273AD446|nr:pachytene checkpoint protein 2 homolog [Topomyia yanbarensis]